MPLSIYTSIRTTADKGLGLFTEIDLVKGQEIYYDDFDFDRVISEEEVDKMPSVLKDYIYKYASYTRNDRSWYLCCDNARFFNHSFTPNTFFNTNSGRMFTLIDLKAGEELTCDYTSFCDHCKAGNFGFDLLD